MAMPGPVAVVTATLSVPVVVKPVSAVACRTLAEYVPIVGETWVMVPLGMPLAPLL